jgi:hypothetical protein
MIEHHRQGVIQAAGEGKCRREEAGQRRIVLAKQRIERAWRLPDAPSAGASSAQYKVTCQPRRSSASESRALAIPPPIIAASRAGCRCGQTRARGDIQRPRHFAGQHFALAAEPFVFCMVKPASCRPRRTKPAEVKVASVPPGRARRAIALNRSGSTCPDFSPGQTVKKPGVHLLIQRIIELVVSVIDIAKPQIQRDPPAIQQQTMAAAIADGHCACSCSAHGASSGQCWWPGADRRPSAEIFRN